MNTKANIAFAQFVNSTMIAGRISYEDAWENAAKTKPDLHTLMLALGATRQQIQFFNSQHQRHCNVKLVPDASKRIEARGEFHAKVHAYMEKHGVDYDRAYSACRREFANVYGASESGGTAPIPAASKAASSDGMGIGNTLANPVRATYSEMPLVNPGLRLLFFLPTLASQEVFNVAYVANEKQVAVIHPAKIFDGLVNYFMDKKSISHDAAIEYCKGEFPELWAAVNELSKK